MMKKTMSALAVSKLRSAIVPVRRSARTLSLVHPTSQKEFFFSSFHNGSDPITEIWMFESFFWRRSTQI